MVLNFGDIDNKSNELNEYKLNTYSKINTKNALLDYLTFLRNKLIDTFSTPSIAWKINDVNCKGYLHEKLKE